MGGAYSTKGETQEEEPAQVSIDQSFFRASPIAQLEPVLKGNPGLVLTSLQEVEGRAGPRRDLLPCWSSEPALHRCPGTRLDPKPPISLQGYAGSDWRHQCFGRE